MIRPINGCAIGHCAKYCIGKACQYWNMAELVCDNCRCDGEPLYKYEGKQLCADCILDSLEQVDPANYEED